MNKPLYRFYFTDDIGFVHRQKIEEYEVGRGYYKYEMPNGYRKYIYKRNIDKLIRMELFSFNGDMQDALAVFRKEFHIKMVKAETEYKRYSKILQNLR